MNKNEMGHSPHRRHFLAEAGAVAGVLPAVSPGERSSWTSLKDGGPVWNVGEARQLFMDRRFILQSRGVTRNLNQPQKMGVVLDSEKEPWELGSGGYFRVIEDAGKFKMYYGAFTEVGHSLCYAESADGLRWTKPSLGLVTVRGNKNNNLIYADRAIDATIMVDHRDTSEKRYKLFRSLWTRDKAKDGIYASYSADGIHFHEAGRVCPLWNETGTIADWDPRIQKYVVFLRVFQRGSANQRLIGRIETDDLLKPWPFRSKPTELGCPEPENITPVLSVDFQDGPDCDFYTNATQIYRHAQDVYLMFPTPFRHFSPSRQPWFRFKPGNDDGLIETQLAISRDGIHWDRPDRKPYIPMGFPDEWDRWLTMMGTGMIKKGSYLYQYYWSTGRMHDSAILRPEYEKTAPLKNAIGALRQRLDGFISADFAYEGGEILTPPLTFSGNELHLNADAGGMGSGFVEIRDLEGKAIPGFTLGDCEEICGNSVDMTVRWKGKKDLSSLKGKPVQLLIKARGTRLYAFQFPGV